MVKNKNKKILAYLEGASLEDLEATLEKSFKKKYLEYELAVKFNRLEELVNIDEEDDSLEENELKKMYLISLLKDKIPMTKKAAKLNNKFISIKSEVKKIDNLNKNLLAEIKFQKKHIREDLINLEKKNNIEINKLLKKIKLSGVKVNSDKSNDRGALLKDIRKGISLKKVVKGKVAKGNKKELDLISELKDKSLNKSIGKNVKNKVIDNKFNENNLEKSIKFQNTLLSKIKLKNKNYFNNLADIHMQVEAWKSSKFVEEFNNHLAKQSILINKLKQDLKKINNIKKKIKEGNDKVAKIKNDIEDKKNKVEELKLPKVEEKKLNLRITPPPPPPILNKKAKKIKKKRKSSKINKKKHIVLKKSSGLNFNEMLKKVENNKINSYLSNILKDKSNKFYKKVSNLVGKEVKTVKMQSFNEMKKKKIKEIYSKCIKNDNAIEFEKQKKMDKLLQKIRDDKIKQEKERNRKIRTERLKILKENNLMVSLSESSISKYQRSILKNINKKQAEFESQENFKMKAVNNKLKSLVKQINSKLESANKKLEKFNSDLKDLKNNQNTKILNFSSSSKINKKEYRVKRKDESKNKISAKITEHDKAIKGSKFNVKIEQENPHNKLKKLEKKEISNNKKKMLLSYDATIKSSSTEHENKAKYSGATKKIVDEVLNNLINIRKKYLLKLGIGIVTTRLSRWGQIATIIREAKKIKSKKISPSDKLEKIDALLDKVKSKIKKEKKLTKLVKERGALIKVIDGIKLGYSGKKTLINTKLK